MAREFRYRHSVHEYSRRISQVGDNHGHDHKTLIAAAAGNKVTSDHHCRNPIMPSIDGGFEAPRNSLDIHPSSGDRVLETLRARSNDIPVGYELYRSFSATRRKTGEEQHRCNLPSLSVMEPPRISSTLQLTAAAASPLIVAEGGGVANKHPNSSSVLMQRSNRARSSSVVARLMGLDDTVLANSSCNLQKEEEKRCITSSSCSSPAFMSCKDILIDLYPAVDSLDTGIDDDDKVAKELPFRNHPQEKQLQEFKKQFAARQALKDTNYKSKADSLILDLESCAGKQDQTSLVQEAKEVLDAIDFLHANKKFFARVLNDPNSPGAKQLLQVAPHLRQNRMVRSPSEPRKDMHAFPKDNTNFYRKQDIKGPHCIPQLHRVQTSKVYPREELQATAPLYHLRDSLFLPKGHMTHHQQDPPNKIVVLKPNVRRHINSSPPSPSNSLPSPRMRVVEGKEKMKATLMDEIHTFFTKESTEMPSKEIETIHGEGKESSYNKDTGTIRDSKGNAKEISINQKKENMRTKTSKQPSRTWGPLFFTRNSNFKKETSNLIANHDGCDDKGRSCSVQKSPRDTSKISPSLPSSPCPSGYLGYEHRSAERERGVLLAEETIPPLTTHQSIQNRDVLSAGIDSCSGQGSKPTGRCSSGRKASRSNSMRETKADNSCKILPRSFSVPAAASAGYKDMHKEKKEPEPNKVKVSESSLFKGRLLSLKESFSLSKKKNKKLLDTFEVTSPITQDVRDEVIDASASERSLRFGQSLSNSSLPRHTTIGNDRGEVISMAQNSHQTDIADTASETSIDKLEQPSPVSVLDAPFQEEIQTSLKSSELDFDLDSKCFMKAPSKQLVQSIPGQGHISDLGTLLQCNCSNELLPALCICNIACPAGRRSDLRYIRDILVCCGFTKDAIVKAHTYSQDRALNPSTFNMLENHYQENSGKASPEAPSRRLLFDIVDKILFAKFEKPCYELWHRLSGSLVGRMYTGKQLLEQIWSDLCNQYFISCESEEKNIDDLLSRDIAKASFQSEFDLENVMIELEQAIFSDLIKEIAPQYSKTSV